MKWWIYEKIVIYIFYFHFVSIAGKYSPSLPLSLEKSRGIKDTIISAILAQQAPDPTSFSLLKQYIIDSEDVILENSKDWTPNGLYNCNNYQCLTVTVKKSALKRIMKMDFISSQPYAMLNNFKVLHSGISEPTGPIIDITEQDDSFKFYLPSKYGYGVRAVTFIPVNGRDR